MSPSQPRATAHPTQEQNQDKAPWPSRPFCSLNPETSPCCPQWPPGCSTPSANSPQLQFCPEHPPPSDTATMSSGDSPTPMAQAPLQPPTYLPPLPRGTLNYQDAG